MLRGLIPYRPFSLTVFFAVCVGLTLHPSAGAADDESGLESSIEALASKLDALSQSVSESSSQADAILQNLQSLRGGIAGNDSGDFYA